MKIVKRDGWVMPQPEETLSAEARAESIAAMKRGHAEWESFLERGVRLVAYTKKHPLVTSRTVDKPKLKAVAR